MLKGLFCSVLQPPRNGKFKLLHKDQVRKTNKFKVLRLAYRISSLGVEVFEARLRSCGDQAGRAQTHRDSFGPLALSWAFFGAQAPLGRAHWEHWIRNSDSAHEAAALRFWGGSQFSSSMPEP